MADVSRFGEPIEVLVIMGSYKSWANWPGPYKIDYGHGRKIQRTVEGMVGRCFSSPISEYYRKRDKYA